MKSTGAEKWCHFLNVACRVFTGAFLGTAIYRIWDFMSHPDWYAMQPTAWYSIILVNAAFTGIVVGLLQIIRRVLKSR